MGAEDTEKRSKLMDWEKAAEAVIPTCSVSIVEDMATYPVIAPTPVREKGRVMGNQVLAQ